MIFCSGFPSTDPNRFLLVAKNIKDHHMFRRSKVSSRKIPLSHKLARRYLPRKQITYPVLALLQSHVSGKSFLTRGGADEDGDAAPPRASFGTALNAILIIGCSAIIAIPPIPSNIGIGCNDFHLATEGIEEAFMVHILISGCFIVLTMSPFDAVTKLVFQHKAIHNQIYMLGF